MKKPIDIVYSEQNESIVPVGINDQPIKAKRCKLCNSHYRQEAELMYERTKHNVHRVHQYLTEKCHEDMSYNAVANHLRHHYISVDNNINIKEYAGEVVKWIDIQNDSRAALVRTIAILEREMWSLGSQNDGLSLDERRKNAESVKKLADTLLSYRSKLNDIDQEREPITLIFNQLQVIIQEEISNVQIPEVKTTVSKILNRLKDSCGDLIVE